MTRQTNQFGAFIPTSFTFDISQIYQADSDSPEFKEIIVKLYQYLNAIALSTNIREAGIYPLQEFVNGQLWFPNPANNSSTTTKATQRQVFRTVLNFGALPGPAYVTPYVKTMEHNIDPNGAFTFTRIFATATNLDTSYIPIPYVSTTNVNLQVEIDVDPVNVTITTGSGFDYSVYTTTYVILEYIKF